MVVKWIIDGRLENNPQRVLALFTLHDASVEEDFEVRLSMPLEHFLSLSARLGCGLPVMLSSLRMAAGLSSRE